MPCRALEAFRRNADVVGPGDWRQLGLNALSGIGGVQTPAEPRTLGVQELRLNALSGIGGVQTDAEEEAARIGNIVLMPCRALEAFRQRKGLS